MDRKPTCHPDRAHQAKGLCAQCYYREYDEKRAERRKREGRKAQEDYASNYRKPPSHSARIPECGHPDAKHVAFGKCGPCYRSGVDWKPSDCHPTRRLVADGLCNACYKKRQYDQNPEHFRRQARESQKRTRERLRDQLIEAYGGKCACERCPETNQAFLTLEHIGGSGKAHRKEMGSHTYADLRRQGFPQDGYTLLCWNCNAGSRHTGVCPHMLDK